MLQTHTQGACDEDLLLTDSALPETSKDTKSLFISQQRSVVVFRKSFFMTSRKIKQILEDEPLKLRSNQSSRELLASVK